MTEPNQFDREPGLTTPESTGEEAPAPFVPSPVSRRIWAWMGVAYVLIVMILITYWIATTRFLTGITGIMLFPALAALCAQGINNHRLAKAGRRGGSPATLLVTAVIMGLVAFSALAWGILQLLGLSL